MNNHELEIYALGYLRATPINIYLSNLDSLACLSIISCYPKISEIYSGFEICYPKCSLGVCFLGYSGLNSALGSVFMQSACSHETFDSLRGTW
jgi:hypothetical protein